MMMKQKYLVGLILLMTMTSNSFAHEENNLLFRKGWTMISSVKVSNFKESLEELSNLDFDIAGVDAKENMIDLLINEHQFQELVNRGYDVKVSETKGVTAGPDQEYKNPEEIETFLKEIHARYKDLTKLVSIGKSLEGRNIWAIKISDDPETNDLTEPSVLFNSMHHAREIMTPEVSIDIIESLLQDYDSNAEVKKWINNAQIWVIPMFNVDGNNKMWNFDSYWRKNTRGGYGVDLNRNYPSGWNSCNGSSGSQSSQTYRGPNPASEPETQAMMAFIKDVRPVFDISYHAYSELVIYPYGCGDRRTQTKEVVEKIGKKVASLLDYEPGTAWELLYNADGGDIDWMYEAYQVIPFVIELNSRRQGFHPKYSKWRDKTVEKNRVGWQYLLKRVFESGVRGIVSTEQGTLSDYSIEVNKVMNGEKKFFQNYVGHKTGAFHLVLNPGTYSLNIKSGGKSLTTQEVTIGNTLERFDIKL
jgi:carboxypeptidase T